MSTPTKANLKLAFENEEKLKEIAKQTAEDLADGFYDISTFIEVLGFALTSKNVDERVEGIRLLSSVLAAMPAAALSSAQLEFISTFYADRMKDHHNVMPPLISGIQALVEMQNIPPKCIAQILRSFFQHTTCQSQVRSDRTKLFKIFKYLSENFKTELQEMSGDFLYGLINSIDGERDPRNLDFIFSFMPDFIAKYPLLHLGEEMFEIFACYFPIDFTPSKNDPDTITRDILAAKLTNCLVSSPEFAESTIMLAVEKLESDLVVAKLDSIELLRQSALKFSPRELEPYFEQIWTALKREIFPGSDNTDIVASGLRALSALLERASLVPEISRNYQTTILGIVLTHLSDIHQRLFNPATALALVCVSGDASFAADKIINTFLLKLYPKDDTTSTLDNQQRIKIYHILAQVYKLASLRNALKEINQQFNAQVQADLIRSLRLVEKCDFDASDLELQCVTLIVLNECVPILTEANRALIYKVLVFLVKHSVIDLDFSHLIIQLAALYPVEIQTNFIDACIRDFDALSSFEKRKTYTNLLPLIPQIAFTERILGFTLKHVFTAEPNAGGQLVAMEALNKLLLQEDKKFIVDLQHNNDLIDRLIKLTRNSKLDVEVLQILSLILSQIMQQLEVAEQYMIVTTYIPNLDFNTAAGIYVIVGLLGSLHRDIHLDEQLERLLPELTRSAQNETDETTRKHINHLLCSMVNRMEYSAPNRGVLTRIIWHLRAAIEKGERKAVETLSWMAKGLIVSGYENAGEIVQDLANLLDHPSLCTAAILAFDIMTTELPGLHLPAVKFLYKQKFFHLIITKMGHKLETYCEHHLNAFIYVLKATPHKVLKMNLEKVGPILFKCLEVKHSQTLCIALHICENFVKHKDAYFQEHLNHLIPSCITLSKYKQSMQVRIAALNLLHDITEYPTFVLLPHKVDTVLLLVTALDDPKRLVRNVAVRTRNAWYLVGAPNGQ